MKDRWNLIKDYSFSKRITLRCKGERCLTPFEHHIWWLYQKYVKDKMK